MGDTKDPNEPKDALADCEETVEHLKEENAVLRDSAQTFGDLAERLSTNRRRGHDRGRKPPTRTGVPNKG